MPAQTKEELLREIDVLKSQIEELEQEISANNAVTRGTSEPGWLITTKNRDYSGVLMGIRFENGRAFLPANHPKARQLYLQFVGDLHYDAQEISAKEYEQGKSPVSAGGKSYLEKISQPSIVGN